MDYNYFLSKDIKIFPCSRPRFGESTDTIFDPASRLITENNLRHLPGIAFGKESYVIEHTDTLWRFVIKGYYFEVKGENLSTQLLNKTLYIALDHPDQEQGDSISFLAPIVKNGEKLDIDREELTKLKLDKLNNARGESECLAIFIGDSNIQYVDGVEGYQLKLDDAAFIEDPEDSTLRVEDIKFTTEDIKFTDDSDVTEAAIKDILTEKELTSILADILACKMTVQDEITDLNQDQNIPLYDLISRIQGKLNGIAFPEIDEISFVNASTIQIKLKNQSEPLEADIPSLHNFDGELIPFDVSEDLACDQKRYYQVCTDEGCNEIKMIMGSDSNHSKSEDYSSNRDQHWNTCSKCSAKFEVENHELEDNTCKTCGKQFPTEGLVFSLKESVTGDLEAVVTGVTDKALTHVTITKDYYPSPSNPDLFVPVTGIGDHAFEGCTSLASIDIPDSVTSIGDAAFNCCESLKSVKIPRGMTSINQATFASCTQLASVTFGDDSLLENIGLAAFDGCTSLASVEIPDSVTSIGSWAFRGCTSLTSVTIPDSVTSIGSNALYGCESLESIVIPFVGAAKNGTSTAHFGYIFGASAPNHNSTYVPGSLKTVVVTGGESICDSAFYNCKSLTSVTIPDSVTSIDSYAFCSCTSLTSVTIGNNVTSIGHYAFDGCFLLESIEIPDSVRIIGNYAFEECISLTNVTLPDSVTSIGEKAFIGCSKLAEVVLSQGLLTIRSGVFQNCTELTQITYCGTEDAWSKVVKGTDWNKTGAETSPATVNLHNYIEEGSICSKCGHLNTCDQNWGDGEETISPTCTETGLITFTCDCGKTKTEILPATGHTWDEGVETITPTFTSSGEKTYTCTTCDETKIEIIPCAQSISGKCGNLDWSFVHDTVHDTGVLSIGGSGDIPTIGSATDFPWYDYRELIKKVIIGGGVTSISAYAFEGYTALTSVTIGAAVELIGSRAFANCTNLMTISIPEGVSRIASDAFYNSSLLQAIFVRPADWQGITLDGREVSIASAILQDRLAAATLLLGCSTRYLALVLD